jgi:hypothetical protein
MQKLEQFTNLFKQERYIITGSLALFFQGLISDIGKLNDIDIIMINPSKESIDILNRLKTKEPNPNYPNSNYYKIKISGDIVFDVWTETTFNEKTVFEKIGDSYLEICTPIPIIKGKANFNRPKDWAAIASMKKTMFPYNIESQLSAIAK